MKMIVTTCNYIYLLFHNLHLLFAYQMAENDSHNPASSQVMPRKLRDAITRAELAIQGAHQEVASKQEELEVLEASIAEKGKAI